MKISWSVVILVLSLGLSSLAHADGSDDLERLIGPKGESTSAAPDMMKNDKILRLTPDRTHLVRLDEDAASVIVTNPLHASVMLDSPRLLVVMPRQPGATTFTVLNSKGDVILEQDVIVSAAQPHYVRVRRMCGASDPGCIPNAYFYCPDGCYEVMAVPGDGAPAEIPEVSGGAQNGNAAPANNNTGNMMPTQGSQQQSENPAENDMGDDATQENATPAIEPSTEEGQ